MSSSVFFRFKSQKEPARVTFDGTGISVFELKREIIALTRLGDGTDFELIICNEDSNEEYDDDTSIIPRSTTVIARRLPAAKPGRGGAARYVSGKMPQNAKNSHRVESSSSKAITQGRIGSVSNALSDMTGAQTEEEKIAAMFKMGADQWAQQQQEMANATPVHRGNGRQKGRIVDVPDHPPPAGYVCYRCHEKGHWIQVCPTNDDPNFDGRPRVKRTTGIPRSFLKTIEKPIARVNDGTVDDTKQPSGVMVNAEGEWVIAEPDQASWDQFRAKANVSAAAQEAAALGSKELQDRGLECTIDKHLFIDPTKTPCCNTTYCNECIISALLENDLRCPACSTENILIDDLIPDVEMTAKVRAYEDEILLPQVVKDDPKSPTKSEDDHSTSKTDTARSSGKDSPKSVTSDGISKKRAADTDISIDRTPPAPHANNTTKHDSVSGIQTPAAQQSRQTAAANQVNYQQAYPQSNFPFQQMMGSMPFSNVGALPIMPMSMGPMMPMGVGIFDPMMGAGAIPNGAGSWNGYYGNTYPVQSFPMPAAGYPNGMLLNGNHGNMNRQKVTGNGFMGMNNINHTGIGKGSFSNQQRNSFKAAIPNEEDSAYFRKPVNPHRHQARRNVNRPADYREI